MTEPASGSSDCTMPIRIALAAFLKVVTVTSPPSFTSSRSRNHIGESFSGTCSM
jgi:hypothetical protein